MNRSVRVPPLIQDSLAALEAREYDRALVLLEAALEDDPDHDELRCVLAAVETKLECLRLRDIYGA